MTAISIAPRHSTGIGPAAAEAYIRAEGLDTLLSDGSADGIHAIPADLSDLARLHGLLRQRRVASVLEFGVGYSTAVIAHALARNAEEFGDGVRPGTIAPDAHHVYSVDTGGRWIELAASRLPMDLRGRVTFTQSACEATAFAGQLCHLYRTLPDVIPEFVYLDGPDPAAVTGTVNGVGFAAPGRTPMAADMLLLEPLLLPGTMILVDGRVNNARFLANNFCRDWDVYEDPDGRFASFELIEPPLGRRNRDRIMFCTGRHG